MLHLFLGVALISYRLNMVISFNIQITINLGILLTPILAKMFLVFLLHSCQVEN